VSERKPRGESWFRKGVMGQWVGTIRVNDLKKNLLDRKQAAEGVEGWGSKTYDPKKRGGRAENRRGVVEVDPPKIHVGEDCANRTAL